MMRPVKVLSVTTTRTNCGQNVTSLLLVAVTTGGQHQRGVLAMRRVALVKLHSFLMSFLKLHILSVCSGLRIFFITDL